MKSDDMMSSMMPKMMAMMMDKMCPPMMEQCFAVMGADGILSMMQEMCPKMMDLCVSKMNIGQRKRMLSMCRKILDEIEKKYNR